MAPGFAALEFLLLPGCFAAPECLLFKSTWIFAAPACLLLQEVCLRRFRAACRLYMHESIVEQSSHAESHQHEVDASHCEAIILSGSPPQA